jgi:hypothetical protein
VVVVLGQVGELILNFEVELEVVVGVSERHDCVSHTAKGKGLYVKKNCIVKTEIVALKELVPDTRSCM